MEETVADMIDIDITLLIQLINFLVLLIILHIILFKPIRQVMKDREQGISSAFEDAKAAQERTQSLLENYNSSLTEAKQKAVATYNSLYQEGLDAQRDKISAERAKAGELLDKARAEIAATSSAARADLRKEADRLSREITSKLLGRAV
jgi:F-type H+-transporting ATPase subunit b